MITKQEIHPVKSAKGGAAKPQFNRARHIAELARLGLTKKELGQFQKDISVILEYFEKLKKTDVSNVEPFTHPHLLENVFRDDEVKKQDLETVDRLIKASPQRKGRYVKVKSVL